MIINSKTESRGFTLIELLVVVAIIGILSSVVLASLNTARNKGADASIKANLSGARAEAEIFYDTAGSYTGVCATTGSNVIGDSVQAAINANGAPGGSYDTVGETCFVTGTTGAAWAASVPLKTASQWFCVDSSGFASTTSSFTIGTTDLSCL